MSGVLKVVIATCALSLMAAHLSPATAAPAAQVVTCVDLASGKERISKTDTCRTTEAVAKWHLAPTDSALASGGTTKSLTICSNKESSPVTYQRIRTSCYKHMQTNLYTRSSTLPAKPIITQVSSASYESASLSLASDPAANVDAPIAYYTITSSKGDVKKINSWRELTVTVSGLRSATSYTFTITATSVDGTSPVSESSLPVTTQVYVAPVAATVIAAPAFTLSAAAETKTVNTAITGYTISSTGGTIASYAISPAAPAGLTFSTTTGLLSGTPTETKTATTYTITASNASGSATQTFALTVSAVIYTVGQRGPGGGIVFYVSATPFTSTGSICNTTCKYLEVAPAGWNNGAVVANDPLLVWSTYTSLTTGQDTVTAGTESAFAGERFNWKIGQGFYNTSVMKVSDATSAAQDAVLAYAGSSTAGQWFIPSMNELNELCKYARGQTTGVLTVACASGGTLKTGTADDLGGFGTRWYWSSSESRDFFAWSQYFNFGFQATNLKLFTFYVRPVRAF
jgi:hypothetical protein